MKLICALTLILCLTLQSCALTMKAFERSPASQEEIEQLIVKMKDYKLRVLGKTEDANCSKEEVDKEFNKMMSSLKKNSCSEDNFVLDAEVFKKKQCPDVKKEGYIDRLVKKIMAEEASKKKAKVVVAHKDDPEFNALNLEAQGYLKKLGDYIHNLNYDKDLVVDLIVQYVDNVMLPTRDIVIVSQSYSDNEKALKILYEALQPYLTPQLVSQLSQRDYNYLQQGPNPSTSPFYLELRKDKNLYRLSYSETDIIKRDVVTLLKAPTAKNYVLSMKWMTLHMMLSQVYVYDTILGNKEAISVPNSCQTHFNANLPQKFEFNYEEGLGEEFLENILAGHGLAFKEDDTSYLDYYVDNVSKDPTVDGYSGMIPFEYFKNAKKALEKEKAHGLEPHFDDVAQFESVINLKMPEVYAAFKGRVKGQVVNYAGFETFQKFFGEFTTDEIVEINLKDGDTQLIYPGKQNLSPYLLEVMKANGISDYSDLITDKIKKKMTGKRVKIDFPSMYSSPIWRDWSLKVLADTVSELRDLPRSNFAYILAENACMVSGRNKKLCTGNILNNLDDALKEFRTSEQYIPTRRLEEAKFKDIYAFLTQYWAMLRDQTDLLEVAKPFELNFLTDQMYAGNPWARLKLSYLVALDQIEHAEDGVFPLYDQKNYSSRINKELFCKVDNLAVQHNNIVKAAKILGLDKQLSYNHTGKFLSSKDKERVWNDVVGDLHQRNAQLFNVKSGGKLIYDELENISYKTILNKNDAKKAYNVSTETSRAIDKVGAESDAQLAEFFLALYKVKDPQKQMELFDKFSSVNGIDNTFSLKLNFLAVDEAYKKPIYKEIIKKSAQTRKMQILDQLNRFCKLNVNDEKEFKEIYHSASKSQNELNQMAGLPSIPNEVIDRISSMDSDEWNDMLLGIGSGLAAMTAIIVGSSCTALSGGLCAPLGGVMAVAGVSALGMQVKLATNEYSRKTQSDLVVTQLKQMEDLGFANFGSADEMHRSYAWVVFEAISIFPLTGIATRSLALGPKLLYASTKSVMRKTGKVSFKAAAKTAVQEEEVRAAQYLLGTTSVSKNLGIDAKSVEIAKDKITRIQKLYTSGQINMETMIKRIAEIIDPIKKAKLAYAKTVKHELGKVVVKQSPQEINQQTAKVITDYFGDNPKELLRLVQSYSGERLNRSLKVMNELSAVDRIDNRIPVFSSIKDWYRRLRNESLAKNANKILALESELVKMGTKKGELEKFVLKNMDDLTDVFLEIPLRKRELPYIILAQGSPEFTFFKGRKIPVLSLFSEGQSLRRIVNARSRLIYESYKSQARVSLKLPRHVKAETTFEAFESFKLAVAELASKKSGAEAKAIMAEYRALEDSMLKKLHFHYQKAGNKIGTAEFKKMMTSNKTTFDRAKVQAIWESVPADELLGMKEVGQFAHKAVMELANYKDIDSFERYISALKVLTINRNVAVLEVI